MRLLTRSDFDGICCAVLLKELGIIDEMVYAHPKDLQDGKIAVTSDDVLANVPYVEGCGLWFDHHSSEAERLEFGFKFNGLSESAPSAARVIYDYYNGHERLCRFDEMMAYVDKLDAARLEEGEVLHPVGWVLLGFICDPRTGLGYHKDFTVSNLDLMRQLVDYIRTKTIEEILELPDIKERVLRYRAENEKCVEFILRHTKVVGKAAVTDARGLEELPPGNRFLVYSLFPACNISIRLIDGKGREFVAFSVGYSILNRSAKVDVGRLMLKYGGGGHVAVGTCQVSYAEADRVLAELVEVMNAG